MQEAAIKRAVVSWIKDHPKHRIIHVGKHYDDSKIWHRFCKYQGQPVSQYEDPEEYVMLGNEVGGGCIFVFTHGPQHGFQCGMTCDLYQVQCAFHSAVIFNLTKSE